MPNELDPIVGEWFLHRGKGEMFRVVAVDAAADIGMSETAMSTQDWRASLESMRAAEESWEDSRAADEIDEEEEGRPLELYEEELESVRDRAQ